MTVKYYAILTNQGAARLANATMLGSKLNLTQMAVGDANGVLPTPDPAQTKLINQKRIAPLNLLSVDPNNQSQIIAEQIIPENEGGFWIREIGLYDDEGVLIAVANCPETYKPQLQEGSGRTQTIRMILVVTNTEAITLKIDPSVVLATRKYVDDEVLELRLYVDDQMSKHIAAQDPHTQYAQKHNPTFTGEPKAPTPAAGNNTTRIATTEFVQAAITALINGAPATLDTLKEIAAAINNDPKFSTTINNALAGKQPLDNTLTHLSGKDVAGLLAYLGLGEVLFKGDGRFLAGTFVSDAIDRTSIGVRAATGCQFMRAYKAPDAPNQTSYWQIVVLPEATSGAVACLAMSGNVIYLGSGTTAAITTWTPLTGRQPLDATLTALSGKSPSDIVNYLGISSNLIPVGVPLPWPLAAPPSGWLLCNGQTFTATQYPALAVAYPALATPDLRGLFIRGLDNGRGYDPLRDLGTEQLDAFASHRHQPEQSGAGNRFVADYSEDGTGSGAQIAMGANNYAMCRYTNYVGGTETRPRNFALNYIVRAA
ncbi:phage tail protein [Salmonella enterica]